MYRILQATVANDRGGLTEYILQNYRHINTDTYQFDFITYDDRLDFADEIAHKGGQIYQVPRPTHIYSYYQRLKKINESNQYKAIHFHLSYANCLPILLAYMAGFKKIIIQSHSTDIDDRSPIKRFLKRALHSLGKKVIPYISSTYLGVSTLANQWMYSEEINQQGKSRIFHTAIDLGHFQFSSIIREQVRNNLGLLNDELAICHIGRFSYQKNQEGALAIFKKIYKENPKAKLYFIGKINAENNLYHDLWEEVKSSGLQKQVVFLGQINNVHEVLQGMDALIMPSRFEGLGMVAIEAQALGIPTYVSDQFPADVKVTDLVQSFPLDNKGYETIAYSILKEEKHILRDQHERLIAAGYNLEDEVKKLEELYSSL